MKYITAVLCLVFCVKCGDGFQIIGSVRKPKMIQSTDYLNPLKLNDPVAPKPTTTIKGALINPTPINKPLQTTGIAIPGLRDVPERNKLVTTFIDNSLVNPTPVLNAPIRLETGPGSPLITDLPINQPLSTTSVARNDAIKPTPVILTTETRPMAMALINIEAPESRPTTEIADRNLIAPSQVSLDMDGKLIKGYTSRIEYKPDQVSPTESIYNDKTENDIYCGCVYSDYTLPTTGLDFHPYDSGNILRPQFTPDGSKSHDWKATRPPNDIRQLIVSLQLNLYINNIPVLAANAVPLYF